MAKGHLYAPLGWAKKKFSELNSNMQALTPFLLWENDGEYTSCVDTKDITLNTDDYEFYEVIAQTNYTENTEGFSTGKIRKGSGTTFNQVVSSGTASQGVIGIHKEITYVSDTKLRINCTYAGYTGSARYSFEKICPMYIIGYKYMPV